MLNLIVVPFVQYLTADINHCLLARAVTKVGFQVGYIGEGKL